MKPVLLALSLLLASAAATLAQAEVLIVTDEFPAMQILAARMKNEEHLESKVVSQKEMPTNLVSFSAVVVYIHGALARQAEDAFIDYARGGGKLVLLHHTISSSKRQNPHWFSFLGISLPEGDVKQGGYKWIEGVTLDYVNLNPNHFIMTNRLSYPSRITYQSTNAPAGGNLLTGFTLSGSEVYLNHVHTEPHTLLMGLKYTDAQTGTSYSQDRAGWIKPAGKGWIIYLMPGHTAQEFENPIYGRIVLNAIIHQP
jgi:hypothetical protein